jgi:tRNA-specific 2-thiouridylase
LDKDLDNNILIVGQGSQHQLLFTDNLTASEINWINGGPEQPFQCFAKTRYRQPDQQCWVSKIENGSCQVSFDQPQRAVTPGQSVVFYLDDHCLGGGTIESTWNSNP